MQSEPIISLPLATVVVALLALFVLAAYGRTLLSRRWSRDRAPSEPDWLPSILQCLPWGAFVVSPSGRVLAFNDAAERRLGVSHGVGAPDSIVEVARRAASTAEPEVANLSIPGVEGMIRVEATPAMTAGRIRSVLFLLREPDAGNGREARYRRMMGALSHELRTPLTAIMGHIDILSSSGPEEAELRGRSQRFIADQVARLARLVEDLLRLSRLDNTPINSQPVNPRSVAEEAISALYDRAEKKGVNILLQASPNLPRVLADRDQLQQVLINLIDNAVKFTPSGTSVSVQLTPIEGGAQFLVRDNGPGIPSQDLPHLFDPFFRGSWSGHRSMPGTGLGLTIVKSILDQHGAKISVESKPGEGSSFSFNLGSAESARL